MRVRVEFSHIGQVTEEGVVVVPLHGPHLVPRLVAQQVLQAEPVGFLSDTRVSLALGYLYYTILYYMYMNLPVESWLLWIHPRRP